jgi:hypothetical protein
MKKAKAVLAASLLAPAVALAFETVDTLPWPSAGSFPAYPRDAVRPTDLWVHGGMMHDSNLLRLESGGQSDEVIRLGGGFRHEQRVIGRQRLVVDARADLYSFSRFSQLDHVAYSGLADWRWEIGNDLSGSIALGRERRLSDLSETRSPRRSLVTATRLSASGAYRLGASTRLRAGVLGARAERDDDADAETRGASASVGADYVSALGNTLGIEARATDGDAPVGEEILGVAFVNNDFEEREVALVASYGLATRLRVDGRVGRTTRRYSEVPDRDFEGGTWRVGAEWVPANKTILALEFFKEPRSIIDISAAHVVVKGVSFGPSWAATNKLVFSARLLREDRDFEGDPRLVLVPGTPLRQETIDTLRFGVGWEPVRQWQVSVALDRGNRDSNLADRDYTFTALTGNVAWRY